MYPTLKTLGKVLCIIFSNFIFLTTINAQVVINEFNVAPNPEWVEFYNSSESAEYIKTYWLDDDTDFSNDTGSSPKKLLSALNITSTTHPFIELSSFLNNDGDFVVLFNADGNLIDQFQYDFNPGDNISVGRYPDGNGGFEILVSQTKGLANSEPPTPTPTLTPTPSPTPTDTPTSTPTPTPSLTPTMTPKPTTPTPTPKSSPTISPAVLGEENDETTLTFSETFGNDTEVKDDSEKNQEETAKKSFPFIAGVFIVAGFLLIGYASVPFLRNWKSKYNKPHDNNDEEIVD